MVSSVTFESKARHFAFMEGLVGGFLQFVQATVWCDIHAQIQGAHGCIVDSNSTFEFREEPGALCAYHVLSSSQGPLALVFV